ncbi:BON domain-containing protein [Rhizobiales bacterium GAS113]|nr:BON domain-containing protein [Rhizobiales bacterium GAS113]
MQARDVMTSPVISIAAGAQIDDAIKLMLRSHLSGLPVIDRNGRLVGILSEGDLLRRVELGTERHRPRWIETFLTPGRTATDYVHTHGRVVDEVMTRELVTAGETTPLEDVVSLMEHKNIKRLPILRAGALVGIVTRADLLRALLRAPGKRTSARLDDRDIQAAIEAALKAQDWMPGLSITIKVDDGVVELDGIILDDRYREAIRVCAENIPGVKAVRDCLVFVEPFTGAYIDPPEEKAPER